MMNARALYEGRWIFFALFLLWILGLIFAPWLALVPAAALLFSIAFFRDPERAIPNAPDAVVSPADGVVTHVERIAARPFDAGSGWRISIFLSVFDVHVNRSPVAGTVLHSEFIPGNFLDARHPEAFIRNQSRTWQIEEAATGRKVEVRQISGAIARRIVAWAEVGDSLEKGERIGMIRFGSRTDLFLPEGVQIVVKPGERVSGGASVLARWEGPGATSFPSTAAG